jgi:hypothetical protein
LPSLDSRGLIYLLLVVIFRIAMSLFPTDIEGHRLTRTGQLHYLFAILTFTFTYMAISNITPLIITDHPWSTIHGLLNVLATLAEITIFLVVVMLLPKLRSIFGLFERLFLVTSNTWIILIALFLIIKTA